MKTCIRHVPSVFVLCLLGLSNINARDFTDEEYLTLPRLFHLDDYHSCLSQKDGLYCLAEFQLIPTQYPNVAYDLIKEYSGDVQHYNRTVIHRGYCVSARCPDSPRVSASLRMQRCANIKARPHQLKASLQTLHYCRSHNETLATKPPDTSQNIFLYIVYSILCLNILGTVYDFVWNDKKKSALLTAWSVRANWQRLTVSYESKDPRLSSLAVLQGCRVVVLLIILYVHAVVFQIMLYLQNPLYVEKGFRGVAGMIMIKGTSIVHMFVMVSSFLCAYNMLLTSEKSPLTLRSFPTNVLKRIIRIAPVYLLVVGYGATWSPRIRDGPLTDLIVGSESQICRQKFWYHVFFVNNIFESKSHCFIQTWFLAVDMQLYILASFLTLALAPLKQRVLPLYAALFFGSCALISGISYIQDWKSLLFIANPESIKEVLYHSPSFQGLYTSPLGCLPACMMGLFIAHLHYYMHESGYKISQLKILNISHNWMIPLYIAWLISGMYIKTLTTHAFTAAYTGIERCIFCIMCAIQLIGSINIDSHFRRFFAWGRWDTFARMSLPVMMVHWCVNAVIVVPRPNTTFSSGFDIAVDASATAVMTYLIAVPISVMVELPMQKFLDLVIIKNIPSCTKQ